jgi:hypothetical protein
MITSIYEGGLGNLLFQVATGINLALNNNDVYKINPNNHIGLGQGHRITNYLDNIFSKIEKTDFTTSNIFEHTSNKYVDIPYSKELCLQGYFQNFAFIKSHKNKLKEIFHFDYINFNKKKEKKILSIHVRGGDYNFYPHFNILNKEYYERCLNNLKIDDYEIFLISDFPEAAKKHIPDIPYKIFHRSELQDMFLLAKSDVCVISNSTFAWWGAFLGDEKITYAPHIWCDGTEEFEGIYTDDMIKISF